MVAYVTVIGHSPQLFEDVRRVLLADQRFLDDGDNIHCDGTTAPLTNIYAIDTLAVQWHAWNPVDGIDDPATMSTFLLECRSPAWVAAIGRMLADAMVEPVWFIGSDDVVWPAGSVDTDRVRL